MRRTTASSFDRIRKPRGSIQKPRTGRNPSIPKSIKATPVATLPDREVGMGTLIGPISSLPVVLLTPKPISASIRCEHDDSTIMER